MRYWFVVLLAACAATTKPPGAPKPEACGSLENKEPPALVAEQPTTSTLGTHALELYRDGLLVRVERPGTAGPIYPARAYHACLDEQTTRALLNDAANEPPMVGYPPPATLCVLPRREAQLVASDHFACARPTLARSLYDAYAQSTACGTEPCAIELEDSEHGSAHDPALATWRAVLESRGHYRCEVREKHDGVPTSYVADEGDVAAERMRAIFERLLRGETSARSVADDSLTSGVAVVGKPLPSPLVLFANDRAAPRSFLSSEDAQRARYQLSLMAAELGPRCRPPRSP